MGLKITGLNELRERLERLRPEEIMARALAGQAERMAARVREGLSEQPGAAGHDEPWLRSGALRDSVGVQADGLQAVVGSSDPAAVPQELGTSRMPPRPFLAPVAAAMGEEIARAVGAAVAAALRGDSPDAGGTRVDLCVDGPDGGEPLGGGAIAGAGTPGTHGGGFMLASGKADGEDDPLRELRKDLGEETPEEKRGGDRTRQVQPPACAWHPAWGRRIALRPRAPGRGKQPSGPKDGKPATIAARAASGAWCSTDRAATRPGSARQPGRASPGRAQWTAEVGRGRRIAGGRARQT